MGNQEKCFLFPSGDGDKRFRSLVVFYERYQEKFYSKWSSQVENFLCLKGIEKNPAVNFEKLNSLAGPILCVLDDQNLKKDDEFIANLFTIDS